MKRATLKPVSCKAKTSLARLLAAELNSSLAAGINLAGISEKINSGGEAEAKGDTQPPPPAICDIWFQSHEAHNVPTSGKRIPSAGPDAKELVLKPKNR